MTAPALIMPMAGRGSRFHSQGYRNPKPLVELHGLPLFVWAVRSVASVVELRELVFIVLREHVEGFAIDERVRAYYPKSRVVVIDEVTAGAAETAAIGLRHLSSDGPVAVNDCDHAFDATGIGATFASLDSGRYGAGLLAFRSSSPAYSYARLGPSGSVVETREKEVVSEFAIAGCYLFRDRAGFDAHYAEYRNACAYSELFMSGLFNIMIAAGVQVALHQLRRHIPFGTPEELSRVQPGDLAFLGEAGSR